MFRDIGKKIMQLAEIYAFAVLGVTAIVFFVLLSNGSRFVWLCLLAGALLFILAWPMYGFGQLVQDVHDMHLSDGRANIQGDDLPHL